MNKTKYDVVVIGNIVKETIVYPNRIYGPVLGSPCAYSSLVMAKLGVNVGMVTYYGNDYPRELIKELRLVDKEGFLFHVCSTVNHLIYQKDGTKRVEYYKSAPMIQYDDIPQNYLDAGFFYICPMNYEVSIELSIGLKELGKDIMVDLGGYGGTTVYNRFTIDTPRGNYYIRSLCQVAKFIKASEEDLSFIMPNLNIEQATQKLIDLGAENVIITTGEKGAFYQSKENDIRFYSAFKTRVENENLNVVGAGDAFSGGFIYEYIKSNNVEDAMIYGNAVASLVLEKEGACVEDRMPSSDMTALRKNHII